MKHIFDKNIQQKIEQLCKTYGVSKLWLFGSYVRDEQKAESDFDFIYLMENEDYGIELFEFADKLEDLLGKDVDIIPYQFMKPRFKKHVETEMVKIYEAA